MRKPILALGLLALVPVLAIHAQSAKEQPHGNLDKDCGDCHSAERWTPVAKPSKFRHESTGFRLEGAHGQASCRACHGSLVFNHVGTACADCHKDAHRGELGSQCESCHVPASWTNQTQMLQVHNRTRLPLFATHARLDCAACHRSQRPYQYATTPAECGNCHLSTYLATTNPGHAAAGFSRRCEDCHSVTAPSWSSSAFSHPATFPLAGGHGGIACSRCHGAGKPHAVGAACVSCHEPALHGGGEPQPHRGRLPAHVRGLPHERVVAAGEVRPRRDPLPADGGAHADRVRALPRGRELQGHSQRLQLLPPAGLRAHDEPEPPGGTLLDQVPGLPQHRGLEAGQLRPFADALRAHGRARADRVRALPRGRALHRHADGLQLLPPAGLRAHHEPEPRRRAASRSRARPATARARGGPRAWTTTAPASR